jgi:hypothetical protein
MDDNQSVEPCTGGSTTEMTGNGDNYGGDARCIRRGFVAAAGARLCAESAEVTAR